jgi:acetolactate synthase small subunit
MIKIPDYREKYNNIDMINKYLEERQMVIPISYGKNIIIQGELYFWVIFKTDERLKQVMKLLKDQVDNGWEILDSKKKKKKEAKNLLLTVPKNEEKQQKNKQPLEKSILRKEYKNQNTNSQKPKEEEVVRIIDQFCKGDLDANAREFILLTNLEYRLKALGPDEVVEIIEQDCRSKVNGHVTCPQILTQMLLKFQNEIFQPLLIQFL